MRCAIVTDRHLNAIVNFYLSRGLTVYDGSTRLDWQPQALFSLLQNANRLSYATRYPNEAAVLEEPPSQFVRFAAPLVNLTPIEALKLMRYLEINCHQMPRFRDTSAWRVLEVMQWRTIELLPGYADADVTYLPYAAT